MKKRNWWYLVIFLMLLSTSCSKHFKQYDSMQFYEYTELSEKRSDDTKYKLVHAYGGYYFLEAQSITKNSVGDTMYQWIPIEKYNKCRYKKN